MKLNLNCSLLLFLLILVAPSNGLANGATTIRAGAQLVPLLSELDAQSVPTGLLYDRVLPLARIGEFDGSADAAVATTGRWRQAYLEMVRGTVVGASNTLPQLDEVDRRADLMMADGVIPIALLDVRYNRIRESALRDGVLEMRSGRLVAGREAGGDLIEGLQNAFSEHIAFTAATMRDRTYRGAVTKFRLSEELYLSNRAERPAQIEVDFDDGAGPRPASLGEIVEAHYLSAGTKTICLTAVFSNGATRESSFLFTVESLVSPDPHDTLAITATIPFEGSFATGEAYVYLADGHASITNPVVVIEGFDLDNTLDWDGLYNLLNQENLIEELRTRGFDAVILNFTEATDFIQANAFLTVELIEQVKAAISPGAEFSMIGASMGGLVARYALTYMESQAMDHQVRTAIFFDSPQSGANIPLGIQYWMDFFSEQSTEAAFLLSRLDTPAGRQMLAYHHTTPPGATGEADSLRGAYLADLASIGSLPSLPRLVAIANGSGATVNQGFAAAAQIIDYEYRSFLVDIDGNVWAVPDGGSQQILKGLIDIILLPAETINVTVSGTDPWDNAPGGWRGSMADMDSTTAPWGDIVALHPNHCFVPTISALALSTTDLFYDVAGDPNLMALTPFDTLYYPTVNQEHVSITPESAIWFLDEIDVVTTTLAAGAGSAPGRPVLFPNRPNPFNPVTSIRFDVQVAGHLSIAVFNVSGRLVRTLAGGHHDAGPLDLTWDGRDNTGREVPSGTFLLRARTGGEAFVHKMTLVR